MFKFFELLMNAFKDPHDGSRMSVTRGNGTILVIAAIVFAFKHPGSFEMAGVLLSGGLVAFGLRKKLSNEKSEPEDK